ncbi:hemophore [Mycolicibacterium sp. S2-37]|uniref:hemophore n=1 Tax=Mycolicibacterium sp. S2-37 TaxID=2810297 RepID=UPI001A945ACB|nr:hemophore [Mycolicibacterium sp. S2-37]MBO0678517.1 hemophore [Mycolicibacterium sp. S2-37]
MGSRAGRRSRTVRSAVKTTLLRRSLYAAFAGIAAGAVLGLPQATAAPDPCAASEVATTVGSVATNTGIYLEANPEANAALTTISQQQQGPRSLATLKSYLDANPQVAKDLQRLQQPLTSLSGRCRLPVTIPQLLSLMQAAQQQGAASAAQAPIVSAPVPAPVSAVTQGGGPLPGPYR